MIIKLLLISLAISFLAACNQQTANESVDMGTVKSQYNKPPTFIGKPHAPVSMSYESDESAELNQVFEIRLTFTVERETEMLEVVYTTDVGLKSADVKQQYQFNNLTKGSEERLTITVIPQQGGLNYINVFASILLNGHQQSRAFAIPVNIDTPQSSQLLKGTQSEPAKGMQYLPEQNVISMPAVEPTK